MYDGLKMADRYEDKLQHIQLKDEFVQKMTTVTRRIKKAQVMI